VPIYEYRCDECGDSFDILQRMSDDPLVTCEKCGGTLRKVLHPVAIHFKGSGFYTTDYGKGGAGRRPSDREGSSEKGSSGESESASSGKSADAGKSADSGQSSDGGKAPDSSSAKPTEGRGKPKEKQKAT
jgi:putative FmdB family regulatory protein